MKRILITMAFAALVGASSFQAQERVTDAYGTEILMDVLPGEADSLSKETLIKELKSVVLFGSLDEFDESGLPEIEPGIHSPVRFSTESAIKPYLGEPVSLASLDAMMKAISKACLDAGVEFSDVLLPEQDISHGVIQLWVAPLEKVD